MVLSRGVLLFSRSTWMKRFAKIIAMCAAGLFASVAFAATPATLKIDVNKPGIATSPMLNGLMTEEINHAFDGGLYAELIQNRSFLDNGKDAIHWSAIGPAGISLER